MPVWNVTDSDRAVLGYIASNWEIARSIGYSGWSIDILVSVSSSARIVASQPKQQSKPKPTTGAIDLLGRINPNECVLCLRCQVNFHDTKTCLTLMRRARTAKAGKA